MSPSTKLYANIKQNNEQDVPAYIPMAQYISNSWLDNGEEARAPLEPDVSIALPATSL